ncbi:alpha-xenorhabdolysin family binary toxin subunit A [Brevibacillus dissolubilis]|uniref:alpha-xenorhabdolysin family binary toxin subunit A n=1 Tax=Brevibacillus dissolubilis TaxID=1844116 RepID=UPI001117794F|nr:alpha-xenorhabdolysin family binary toxin subunit A [Brevibacillus dissolubilis]
MNPSVSAKIQSLLNAEAKADFGPGELVDSSTQKIILKAADWVTLQRYTGNGIELPTNEAQIREKLVLDQSIPFPPAFAEIYPVYSSIQNHTYNWQKNTYPKMLNVATSIKTYSIEAPEYYEAMAPLIDEIRKGNTDAMDDFRSGAADLAKQAQGYADEAKELYTEVHQFYVDTQGDSTKLTTLKKQLDDAYGANSQEVTNVQNEIDSLNDQLKKLEKAYSEYETITKLLYLFGPLFGFISNKVADAIKGTALEKQIEGVKQQIQQDEDTLKRDKSFSGLLQAADQYSDQLSQEMAAAIPVIQKIQGLWDGLSKDLAQIANYDNTTLQQNVDSAFLDKVHLNTAADMWKSITDQITMFRIDADVSVI